MGRTEMRFGNYCVSAYVAEYKAIGNRLQDLPDGYLPEECRMSSFKLIRSPIDAMCRRFVSSA